jgi:hypothetical protein
MPILLLGHGLHRRDRQERRQVEKPPHLGSV